MSEIPAAGKAGGSVIVLTYSHAGAGALARMLSASRALACTSGTGLLPLCHLAAETWKDVESRATPSPLAVKSVRALASTIITVIQAQAGASRWCETAIASPATAATFLRIFPTATFLCLHRSLSSLFAESMTRYPWGLGGSPFWPYSGPHPGNNGATIATYWAACTEPLLDFEADHPDSCLRVRHEDLVANSAGQAAIIYARLGLDPGDLAVLRDPAEPPPDFTSEGSSDPAFPKEMISAALLAKINELHARLSYPTLA